MIYLEIGENEQGQRVDRFLRKYLANAPLSLIYKIIRKDIKVNGVRPKEKTVLELGDRVELFISEADFATYTKKPEKKRAKRQFGIAYEDENVLIVEKPYGLLTHGDGREKKNHLANQVIDYLIEKGEYNPRTEMTFVPASANRIDRNTTGLVIFCKNAEALRECNRIIKDKSGLSKIYLAVVSGAVKSEMHLRDFGIKDQSENRMVTIGENVPGSREMLTIARPIAVSGEYSLLEVEILTGRTHQIRTQLSSAGHPIVGDPKYGRKSENQKARDRYGVEGQLLHAWKLTFHVDEDSVLAKLNNLTVEASIPDGFREILQAEFPGFSQNI